MLRRNTARRDDYGQDDESQFLFRPGHFNSLSPSPPENAVESFNYRFGDIHEANVLNGHLPETCCHIGAIETACECRPCSYGSTMYVDEFNRFIIKEIVRRVRVHISKMFCVKGSRLGRCVSFKTVRMALFPSE